MIQGEGAAWGAGAFAASLLTGVVIERYRGAVGLENVTIIYLLIVVVAAGFGGRAAGLWAALSAALSYNFFLTTPYHTLAIDSASQVVTVALLFAAGIAASLVGRTRRRTSLAASRQTEVLELLNAITRTAAADGDPDRVAAAGLRALLDARQVVVRRTGPAGVAVTADPPGAVDVDERALPRLDPEGRLPRGVYEVRDGRLPRHPAGVVAPLLRGGREVGELLVITAAEEPISHSQRLVVATVAHALAVSGPKASTPNGQPAAAR